MALMKTNLPFRVAVITFTVVLATSILHIVSLFRALSAIRQHSLSEDVHLPLKNQLRWNSLSQVSLEFKNDGFHITSDKDWEALQVKFISDGNPAGHTYVISMQQQLRCLNVIRVAYLSYHTARPKMKHSFYDEAEACIEQIRQQLMCHTDLSLEATGLVRPSDGIPATNGTGVIHRCRNWRDLAKAVDSLVA